MVRNPVIAAWIAGGLIWGAALFGLGAMGGPDVIDDFQGMAQNSPWTAGAEDVADAYERALDGDAWGDADALPDDGVYRPASAPDS